MKEKGLELIAGLTIQDEALDVPLHAQTIKVRPWQSQVLFFGITSPCFITYFCIDVKMTFLLNWFLLHVQEYIT